MEECAIGAVVSFPKETADFKEYSLCVDEAVTAESERLLINTAAAEF